MDTINSKEGPYYTFWTQHPVIRRYSSLPLSDIIPIVFVLYAAYRDATVQFDGDGRLLGYVEPEGCKDAMLGRLFKVTRSQLIDDKCREAEELAQTLPTYVDDQFKDEFPLHMEHFILDRRGIRHGPFHPDDMQSRINEILQSHNASSIYEYGGGLGMIARTYDGWEKFDTYDSSRIHSLYADLLNELKGKKSVFRTSRDYISMPLMMSYYDTVIASLMSPASWDGRRMRTDSIRYFFDSLVSLDTWKTAIVLVNYSFCVCPEYESVRNLLCERGILEEVSPFYSFDSHDGKTYHTAIVVLNACKASTSPVVFTNTSGKKAGHAEPPLMRKIHYVLDPRFYYPCPDRCLNDLFGEGADTVVSFGDLIKKYFKRSTDGVNFATRGDRVIGIQEDDYSNDEFRALRPKSPHVIDSKASLLKIDGPAISIIITDSVFYPVKVCRVDSDSGFVVSFQSISFVPSDDVDISYFVFLLFQNKGVRLAFEGLRDILYKADYGSNIRCPYPMYITESYLFDILSARPVRIVADKKKQRELVERLSRSAMEVVKTDNEYGVALVGNPLTDDEKENLPGWLISVVAEPRSVAGEGGLQELLAADREKPLPSINAVIVNSKLDYDEQGRIRFRGLNDAQKLSGFYPDIPFLFYSDARWEDLGDMVYFVGDNLTCHGNQFIERQGDESLKGAIRDLRNYLDASHSPDSAIRRKYAVELSIADHLDPAGDLTFTLLEAMRDDFTFDDNLKKTEDKFGNLRKRAERIFNEAKSAGLLPPLKNLGQMQQLLADPEGEFYDNNTKKMYKLKAKGLMPSTLACAFAYFVRIANGGTHDTNDKEDRDLDVSGYVKEINSPNIYKSCVFVLFDLLRWYGSLVSRFNEPLFEEIRPFDDDDRIMLGPWERNYYYIGNVHLKNRADLVDGIPGRAIRLEKISLEKQPRMNGPRYYSADYHIDKKLV